MDWPDINWLQWPAMVITLAAGWLVASSRESLRNAGFWVFLVSNAVWIVWALQASAWALIVLQVGLAVMNIRGAKKNSS